MAGQGANRYELEDADRNELAFYRFAWRRMYACLGPADSEIVGEICRNWVAEGKTLPKRFRDDD